jgi:NAD(P)-dependent dehydrogenase (short-subunit alcohol dehydrogenase family)
LHLVNQGTSPITLNATLTGLKFFFGATLGRGELMAKTSTVRVPQTLPVVLSRDEVARLIGAFTNLKHQTALTVAYGAGLAEETANVPLRKYGTPRDVAGAVDVLLSVFTDHMTGHNVLHDGGFTRAY